MLRVDNTKCKMCKKCISECRLKCLAEFGNTITQVAPQLCMACGHCAAVCTHNAITLENNPNHNFILADFPTLTNKTIDVFRKTRSISKFKSDKIDADTLINIISLADMAPSCENNRNREYVIVNDVAAINTMDELLVDYWKMFRFLPAVLIKAISLFSKTLASEVKQIVEIIKSVIKRKLEKGHMTFRNAPCAIFIVGPKNSIFAKEDCLGAQHYMRLSATTMGIASCIIGFAQDAKGVLEKYLKIDKNKKIYAATIFGIQENPYIKDIVYKNPTINWR
jgi:ferredoxin